MNLDGVRINIRLRSGATLLPLVPKMTGSWRLAECTSPISQTAMVNIRAAIFLLLPVDFTIPDGPYLKFHQRARPNYFSRRCV